jgi:anti-sigma regulatory factor (Ser/Thr protein kinase)
MRTAVRSWLAPLRLDGSIEDALILATNEAPCNAVDHAHPPAGGDNGVGGTVDLALHTERGRACVEITDHGSWLEPAV